MLFPIEDKTQPGSEDIWLLYESHSRVGDGVIVIVASVKPWCREWRAYWLASTEAVSPEDRFDLCKTEGHKMDPDVARAMFPDVERDHDVEWKG